VIESEEEIPVLALPEPAAAKAPPAARVDFVKQIKPILEAHCVKCHGPKKTSSGYRLHTKELAFKRGDKAEESDEDPIVAGDAKHSLLFQLISLKEDNDDHMPPKGKAQQLTKEQIELIRKWIDGGASWPDKVELTPPPDTKEER
jgi:mono/diheme cytochrome c family protein